MSALVATCRRTNAVLGSVSGHFDGTGRIHLLTNCLNSIDAYEVLQQDGREVTRFVKTFPVNGTIRHMLGVPLPSDGCGQRIPRLCLFIVTERQDVSIVLLSVPTEASGMAHHAGGNYGLIARTLFYLSLATGLFKPHCGHPTCAVSTYHGHISHAYMAASVSPSATLFPSPIVVLSFHRGQIILFDVAACIADGAELACIAARPGVRLPVKRRRDELLTVEPRQDAVPGEDSAIVWGLPATVSGLMIASPSSPNEAGSEEDADITSGYDESDIVRHLTSLNAFSETTIRNELLPKRSKLPYVHCPIAEVEPRSIALHQTATKGLILLILYQDCKGHAHIRRYTVEPVTAAPPYEQPLISTVLDRSVLRRTTKAPSLTLSRAAMLQSNVESDAALLLSVPGGALVCGGALVSFIATDDKAVPSLPCVSTATTPEAARSEPRAATVVSPCSVAVAYANGAIVIATLDDGETYVGGAGMRRDITAHLLTPCSTPATSLTLVSSQLMLVGSSYASSLFVSLVDGKTEPAFDSIGPIVNMWSCEAGQDGSLTGTVVAATGADVFGTLHSIRAAMPLVEDATLNNIYELTDAFAVPLNASSATDEYSGILALSFPESTQFISYIISSSQLSLEETPYACPASTLLLRKISSEGAVLHVLPYYATISHYTAFTKGEDGAQARVDFSFSDGPIFCCAMDPANATLAVGSGPKLALLGVPSLELLRTVIFPCDITCLEVTDKFQVLIGLWETSTIMVISAADLTPRRLVQLEQVPHSLRCCALTNTDGTLTPAHIFIGHSDGTVTVAVMPDNEMELQNVQSFGLGTMPVSLSLIESSQERTIGVICSCDCPAVFFPAREDLEVTGLGSRSCDIAVQLSPQTFLLYSSENGLVTFSTCGTTLISRRIDRLSTPLHETGPLLTYIPQQRQYAVAQRGRENDVVALFSMTGAGPQRTDYAQALPLEPQERCEMLEWIVLNGTPFTVGPDEVPRMPFVPLGQQVDAVFPRGIAGWDPAGPFGALILGTCYYYPHDDVARSGRLMLVGLASDEAGKMSMIALSSREVRGMPLSACMVPNTNNRLIVGITGSVHLFKWGPSEAALIPETLIAVGCCVMRLIPMYGTSLGTEPLHRAPPSLESPMSGPGGLFQAMRSEEVTSSSLVLCADMRNGLIILEINAIDLMVVVARDRLPREVMDVAVIGAGGPSCGAGYAPRLLTADTDLNLCLLMPDVSNSVRGGSLRMLVDAQIHLGDRVTTLRRGSFQVIRPISRGGPWTAIGEGTHPPLIFGTAHGTLGCIIPLADTVGWFLGVLLATIVRHTVPFGGLSWISFRSFYRRDAPINTGWNPVYCENGRVPDSILRRRAQEAMPIKLLEGTTLFSFIKEMNPEAQMAVTDSFNLALPRAFLRRLRKQSAGSGDALDGFLAAEVVIDGDEGRRNILTKAEMDKANEVLSAARLPLMPVTCRALVQLLIELQRFI